MSKSRQERRRPPEMRTEQDRERDHELRFNESLQRWGTVRLAIVAVAFLIGIGLCIPLAQILAGTTTSVSINVALSFSIAATLATGTTGTGWILARRGKKKALAENRKLRAKLRQLQAQGSSEQPMLSAEMAEEGT